MGVFFPLDKRQEVCYYGPVFFFVSFQGVIMDWFLPRLALTGLLLLGGFGMAFVFTDEDLFVFPAGLGAALLLVSGLIAVWR